MTSNPADRGTRASRHSRRGFLHASAALGAALLLPRSAEAAQVRSLQGKVTINGKSAKASTPIQPGDVVVTGPGAKLVFVLGEDAFLVRQNSRVSLDRPARAGSGVIGGLRILSGALLAVFGKGQRRLVTSTATIGIRGTGIYVEAARDQTYLCACYGDVEVRDHQGKERRRLISGYHTPAMIYADAHAGKMVTGAEFKNHTDEELVMLERLVGRTSPVKLRDEKLKEGAAARSEAASGRPAQEPSPQSPPNPSQPASAAQPELVPEPRPSANPPAELEWRLPPPPLRP